MGKKRLLIATLGTSPAVVTEAIDLLSEQGQCPDSICIIKTRDSEVNESFKMVSKYVPKIRGIKLEIPVEIPIYNDIDSNEAAIEFMNLACDVLKKYSNEYECYICIAGGRKVMSALLALAVKLYGAKRLFHIWAPKHLEEQTEIRQLRCLEKYNERELTNLLYPELIGSERPRIIDLPMTDIE